MTVKVHKEVQIFKRICTHDSFGDHVEEVGTTNTLDVSLLTSVCVLWEQLCVPTANLRLIGPQRLVAAPCDFLHSGCC